MSQSGCSLKQSLTLEVISGVCVLGRGSLPIFCAQTYILDFKHKEGDFGTRVGWSAQEVCVIGHLKVWERGDAGSNQSSLDDSGIDVDKPELRILCPWRKRHRISNCISFFLFIWLKITNRNLLYNPYSIYNTLRH